MQEDYLEFVKQLLNVREGDKVNGPTTLLFASTGLTTTQGLMFGQVGGGYLDPPPGEGE